MNPKKMFVATALATTFASAAQAQTLETLAASRQYRGEEALEVKVRFGIGDFFLTRDEGTALYRASVVYDKRFNPVLDYTKDTRTLEIGIDSPEDVGLRNLRGIRGQRVDLSISPTVPMSLDFEFGAGNAELDLGGLALEQADVKTGASETTIVFSRPTIRPCQQLEIEMGAAQLQIEGLGNSNCSEIQVTGAAGSLVLDFTGEWQHEGVTQADVQIGLGGVTLRLPRNLGVAIEVQRFLASFDSEGFLRDGKRYVSPNYDRATTKLHLDLQAAVGDINVEWVPGR